MNLSQIFGRDKKWTFWISRAGYCVRRVALEYLRGKSSSGGEIRHSYREGKMYHEAIEAGLSVIGRLYPDFTIEREKPVSIRHSRLSNVVMIGRVDAYLQSSQKSVVLELKSLERVSEEGLPRPEDRAQTNGYLSKFPGAIGVLLYVGRNGGLPRMFEFKFDPALYSAMSARVETVYYSVMEGRIPPPEAKYVKEKQWECAYCPFANLCAQLGG